jgi:ribonuclease BN (tRNA processing enzyme)
MRVHILRSGPTPGHPLTGFVIDGVLAVDAGPLGHALGVDEQANVADVLLTHSHIDHVAGLPIFLDNVYRLRPGCPMIRANSATLESLQTDVFNGRQMPDFIALSRTMPPFLCTEEVPNGQSRVGRYSVMPLELDHTVPTTGYLIDDGETAVAILTDTGPVPEVFAPLARRPRLKAVFLECSYPRRLTELAAVTKHLTTAQFADAARTFPPEVEVYATHIKPRYWDEIVAELQASGVPNVRVGEPGEVVEV